MKLTPLCADCKNYRDGFCLTGRMPAREFRELAPRHGGCGSAAIKKDVEPMKRTAYQPATVYREPYIWR